MLHDLLLHVVESTPQSSSVKHLWSARASWMWQALSTCWLSCPPEFTFVVAGQTCKDIALARLACFSLCTSKNFITYCDSIQHLRTEAWTPKVHMNKNAKLPFWFSNTEDSFNFIPIHLLVSISSLNFQN
jgi:hypothetical protein